MCPICCSLSGVVHHFQLTPLTSTIFTLYGLAFDPDFDGAIAGYDLQVIHVTVTAMRT